MSDPSKRLNGMCFMDRAEPKQMVDFPRRPKITDPMEVWEAYWQASAEAIVWLVRTPEMIGLDHEAIAKKLKASAMVVDMALALNPYSTDVLSARSKRRKLLGVLIENYLPVARNLAIEKAKQTGEDFGCYLAIGEQTIRETIPRWQTGRAPFANYVNPRCKWAFHDEVHRGRWSQAVEITEEFVDENLDEADADSPPKELMWQTVKRLPREQKEVVLCHYQHGLSLSEIADRMSTTVARVKKIEADATRTMKHEVLRRAFCLGPAEERAPSVDSPNVRSLIGRLPLRQQVILEGELNGLTPSEIRDEYRGVAWHYMTVDAVKQERDAAVAALRELFGENEG